MLAHRDMVRPVAQGNTAEPRSLGAYVDSCQANGQYSFTREQALGALFLSDEAFRKAVQRLIAKKRLVVPRRGFYVILPLEYIHAGALPPDWYVDALMRFSRQQYYVGLLSAASLYGAAHHQPQQFQIITSAHLRPVLVGRVQLCFYEKRRIKSTPVVEMKTETGSMHVSTPEATAIDLLRYPDAAGQLANIANVLAELAEKIDGERLMKLAMKENDVALIQRLGYLLTHVGAQSLSEPLAQWVSSQQPRYTGLQSAAPTKKATKDKRWRLLVNDDIEVDV